jgi:2-keto-4-pentenoate hydratase
VRTTGRGASSSGPCEAASLLEGVLTDPRPAAEDAAAILWEHWQRSTRIGQLPLRCRPRDRAEGYAIQAELARLSGQRVAGWKIAATSTAGQRHIGVDGPLAGRLLSGRLLPSGSPIDLAGNTMRVAEAEFAFRMAAPLPPRTTAYTIEEVADATASLHPAIEVPDSRYEDFAVVGAPQLIADMACACWAAIGPAAPPGWRARDLAAHRVAARRDGRPAGEGRGENVLGGPFRALAWLANEVAACGGGLRAGDVVITGTCVPPVRIEPGSRVCMDFGELGQLEMAFDRG